MQQSAVRHNRPAAQPTSIGTESLRTVDTSTAKVRSYLQRHPGEASLATYSTENHLQTTLPPCLQVPPWRGPRIPWRDFDTTVGCSSSSSHSVRPRMVISTSHELELGPSVLAPSQSPGRLRGINSRTI